MKLFNRMPKTIVIALKAVYFLFTTSKLFFVILFILNISSGILISLNLIIWKKIVDTIAALLASAVIDYTEIIILFSAHILLKILANVIYHISSFINNQYSYHVDMQIAIKTLSVISELDHSHFDDSNIYDKISQIKEQSLKRNLALLENLFHIVKAIVSMLGILIIISKYSHLIVMLCFALSIPVFIVNNKILDKWFAVYSKRIPKFRLLNTLKAMITKYDNIKEMKLNNIYKLLNSKICGIYKDIISEDKSIRKKFLLQNIGIESLDAIVSVFLKLFIVYKSFTEKITIGTLLMYIEAVDYFRTSINNLFSLFSNTYEDCLYINDFFELISIPAENLDQKKPFNDSFKEIIFNNVSFKYPNTDNYVIKDFNYKFKAKMTYGLVGLNGSGKTTLIKLILNLYNPDSGEILIDGVDIREICKKSYYTRVGAIFQDFIKYPFDLLTNITHGESVNPEDFNNALGITKAQDFIEKLPNKEKTQLQREWAGGVELSIGQWQKIAVARAFIKKSSIIILDEPTSSFDVLAEYDLYQSLMMLKTSKLCFFVTHRLANMKMVDEVLVLEDGRLVESGKHDNLINNNKLYSKLYNMQISMCEN